MADTAATETAAASSQRYDSSLGLLTKRFVALIKGAPSGILDLNQAATQLEVQKRRIYDITNVLEGIGLIEKRTKNNIAWKGSGVAPSAEDAGRLAEVRGDLDGSRREEAALDRCVEHLQRARTDFCRTHAADLHITHGDLRKVPGLGRETIVALRAPPGTVLEVPDLDDGMEATGARRYQLQLRSPVAPIEVFLVDRAEQAGAKRPHENLGDDADAEVAAANDGGSGGGAAASATGDAAAKAQTKKRHRSQTPPSFGTPSVLSKYTPTADQLDKDFVFDIGAVGSETWAAAPVLPKIEK